MLPLSQPTNNIEPHAISEGKVDDIQIGACISVLHKILVSMKSTCSIPTALQFLQDLVRKDLLVVDDRNMHNAYII